MAPTEWLKVMALSVEITRLEFKPHTAYLTAVSIKPLISSQIFVSRTNRR